jgi:hypothetical protein
MKANPEIATGFKLPPAMFLSPAAFERLGDGLTQIAEAQMALVQAVLRLQFGVFGAMMGAPADKGHNREERPSVAAHKPDVD